MATPANTEQHLVLASVDASSFADSVTDHAVWAAHRLGAPLELLHVIDRHPERATVQDHSGSIGIDAQQQLLETLSEDDAERSRDVRGQGRELLNRLRERARNDSAALPDIRQRHGQLVETLVERQAEVGLFVLGRRGVSAGRTNRDLGRGLENVIRALHRPILVATEQFAEPDRALFAFDGSAALRSGLVSLLRGPLLQGLSVHVVVSGATGSRATAANLAWAQATLAAAGVEVTGEQLTGDVERAVASAANACAAGLLIMGAYSHSPWRKLLRGSRTADLLRSSRIPALLLR